MTTANLASAQSGTAATPAATGALAAAVDSSTPSTSTTGLATAATTATAAPQPPAGAETTLLAYLSAVAPRLVLVAVFTGLLALRRPYGWWQTGIALGILSLAPASRKPLLVIAAALTLFFIPPVNRSVLAEVGAPRGAAGWVFLWPVVVIAVMLGFAALSAFVRRHPKSYVGRRPVLILIATLVALMLAATHLPLRGLPWFLLLATTMTLGSYLWFFAFSITDAKLRPGVPLWRHAGYWRPFWGFSNVPIGKGAGYLDRVEAKDNAQLFATQIKGLKLLAWATALALFTDGLSGADGLNGLLYEPRQFGYGRLAGVLGWWPAEGLPTTVMALERYLQGNPYPLVTSWVVMFIEFIFSFLRMAIWGHTIIAVCRMAGFNAAPNTDRPLLATSIADFYNRIYYYFKELLAAFFFYPSYLRFFKTRPRLRLFAATLMAAGFGNFLFHFLREDGQILRDGIWAAFIHYHVYAVYCLILGTAIALSQVRLMAHQGAPPTGARKLLAIGGVWVFYSMINVIGAVTGHNILEHGSYFLSLFGLR